MGLTFSLLDPARWLLLVSVAIAPWAYGCIPPGIIPWFTGALLASLVLWIGGLLLRKRSPAVSLVLSGFVACLVVHGWLLVVNAGYRYDRSSLRFVEIKPLLAAWLPGAIDTTDAKPMMLRMTGLLGVILIAADAARHSIWRRRLFWAIVTSGTLLVFYGLAQRICPVPLLFWEQADLSHNLFATFYYHGNAGAFVNLSLPFVFGAAVHGFNEKGNPALRAFGAAALFLNVAAAVAIASKAAQLVTVMLLVASVVIYRRKLFSLFGPHFKNAWLLSAALGLICLGTLALNSDTARQRWGQLPQLLNSENTRLLAYKACLRMLPDAGLWGIGPGNFAIAFPHYTHGLPDAIQGIWRYAHEDYLQTVIEWGWLGTAVWAAIFFGAWGKGLASLRTQEAELACSPEDLIIYRSAFLALSGVAIHSLVDFPLQIGAIQIYAVTMIGLLWHSPGFLRKNSWPQRQNSMRRRSAEDASAPRNAGASSDQ